jgi:ribonuclease P protein component
VPPLAGLKRRAEFLAAARARRAGTPSFTLQARARRPEEAAPDTARVGFTCSRKVGNAVARNRAKRRLRAAAREVLPEAARAGWDYVLIGRRDATAERPYPLLLDDLRGALAKVHASAPPEAPRLRSGSRRARPRAAAP